MGCGCTSPFFSRKSIIKCFDVGLLLIRRFLMFTFFDGPFDFVVDVIIKTD